MVWQRTCQLTHPMEMDAGKPVGETPILNVRCCYYSAILLLFFKFRKHPLILNLPTKIHDVIQRGPMLLSGFQLS